MTENAYVVHTHDGRSYCGTGLEWQINGDVVVWQEGGYAYVSAPTIKSVDRPDD